MATISEEIKIVYEDKEMLVLNKPAGWVVTKEQTPPASGHLPWTGEANKKQKFIEDWVGENYPNSLPRKGIVHRLDKGTSGLLVVAKNQEALDFLKQQFKSRQVKKHYLALVSGDLSADGQVNMPIGRSRYGFGKFKVDEEGKVAVTEFKLIKKIKIEGRIYSLAEINLKTGRTHQIRVHMSYLGWPLLGDKTYGGPSTSSGLNRPFLHAYELTIKRPSDEELMTFRAELPTDLKKIIELYEK